MTFLLLSQAVIGSKQQEAERSPLKHLHQQQAATQQPSQLPVVWAVWT